MELPWHSDEFLSDRAIAVGKNSQTRKKASQRNCWIMVKSVVARIPELRSGLYLAFKKNSLVAGG